MVIISYTFLTYIKNFIIKQLSTDKINSLCELIHKNVNVVFLCPNNTSGTIIKFQQELMFASKIINVISSSLLQIKF
jgi:histidinol-phosphate/aromatic aminotransferase/cobyric acid decarboxylase-like protein